MNLTIQQVEKLLAAMKLYNKDAEIDFTNRTIRVLSEVKVDKKTKMSDGFMKYQDILYQIKG